jgi:hypothetical protein
MRIAARQTSIDAYDGHAKKLAEEQQVVFNAVRACGRNGSCIADVHKATGLDKSAVSARFHEQKPATLENPNGLGKLEFVGKFPSLTTKISSEFWRVKIQGNLFER